MFLGFTLSAVRQQHYILHHHAATHQKKVYTQVSLLPLWIISPGYCRFVACSIAGPLTQCKYPTSLPSLWGPSFTIKEGRDCGVAEIAETQAERVLFDEMCVSDACMRRTQQKGRVT